MSTRAIYTFEDGQDERHVYIHHDGYPTGAADKIRAWQVSGLSWPLPRFEADEAAAGFIAANKTLAGSVRVAASRTGAIDVEFGYRFTLKAGALHVQCVATDYWGEAPAEHVLYDGPVDDFYVAARRVQEAAYA